MPSTTSASISTRRPPPCSGASRASMPPSQRTSSPTATSTANSRTAAPCTRSLVSATRRLPSVQAFCASARAKRRSTIRPYTPSPITSRAPCSGSCAPRKAISPTVPHSLPSRSKLRKRTPPPLQRSSAQAFRRSRTSSRRSPVRDATRAKICPHRSHGKTS